MSGRVTRETELECEAGEDMMESSFRGDEDGGSSGGDQGEDRGRDDSGEDAGDDQGAGEPSCTTAEITPGAVVIAAELRISSGGATWEKVELGS